MMTRMFTISWPKWGKTVQAELLGSQEPELCERFWNALPAKSIQSHAVCAGYQMYFPFRLANAPAKRLYEPMNEQPAGRVNLELDFQYMAINYGPLEEPVPALAIAQIREDDLKELEILGKMAWDNLLFSDEFIQVVLEKM